MPNRRLTVACAALLGALLSGPVLADNPVATFSLSTSVTQPLLTQLPIFNPVPKLAQTVIPSNPASLIEAVASVDTAANAPDDSSAAGAVEVQDVTDLRKALIAAAMQLRNIRYVRGGHSPTTGFDCSGFVRYVFENAIGVQLPRNSASQFLEGSKIKRADMKPGDLVFFHTHGRRRITHVGIYISEGRFIHSPTTGKSVEISSLDSGYWAKRFAGAKRPEEMALAASAKG